MSSALYTLPDALSGVGPRTVTGLAELAARICRIWSTVAAVTDAFGCTNTSRTIAFAGPGASKTPAKPPGTPLAAARSAASVAGEVLLLPLPPLRTVVTDPPPALPPPVPAPPPPPPVPSVAPPGPDTVVWLLP